MTGIQPRDGKTTVHLVLQGKGGVGKSLVACLLAQFLRTRFDRIVCLDTDPVNATFAGYQELSVERINVLKRGSINPKQFDVLVERLCTADAPCVVDTGATTFLALWAYIIENQVLSLLDQHGRRVYAHSVVAGGQAMRDTLHGFATLAQTTTEKNVIVWLNEYFGEIAQDGETFDTFRVTRENAEKLVGSVLIPERNPGTFGDDVKEMLDRHLTFDGAIQSEQFSLVSKQRLQIVKRDLFQQLEFLLP